MGEWPVREPWYASSGPEETAQAALDIARRLYEQHRADQCWHTDVCESFYDGVARSSQGLVGALFSGLQTSDSSSQYNVIASVVDTFTSHVVKNRIKLFALTSAGEYEDRKRAVGINRALEAMLDAAGIYGQEGTLVAKDGCLTGDGVVKVTPDYASHRVLIERCLAEEIYVDDQEARLGRPSQLVHIQRIDRAVLVERFPDQADAVQRAAPAGYEDMRSPEQGQVADQVLVYEVWHLPSSRVDATLPASWGIADADGTVADPGHDGRHVLFLAAPVSSGTGSAISLLDEPWPLGYFPFAWFRPKTRPRGFRGRGFVEVLRHVQLQINKMLRRVDGIMQLHSIMTVYVNRNANLNIAKVKSNDWSRILEGDGPGQSAIQHISPQAVSGDYIQQIERLIQWGFQQVGLSELSVAAQKPAGIEAGVALRTLLDTESIRHTDVFRAWEAFHLDLGRAVTDAFRLLAWNDPDFEIVWAGDKDLERIKWRDVDLDESKWRLRIWPTNLLPETPTAKLEKALELYKEGAFTREDMLSALQFPDVEAILGDKSAAQRNVERKLDGIVEDGYRAEYAPHGLLDLALAIRLGLQRFNALEADGASVQTLEDVQRWVEDCISEQKKITPAATAPGAQAAPAPLPNSAGPLPPASPPGGGGPPLQ